MNTRPLVFVTTRGLAAAALTLTAFALSAHPAQAQFSFSSPLGTTFNLHPGDTLTFSGTFTNPEIEQLDSVTILFQETKPGVASFASPFFADLTPGEGRNFTGTLKVLDTAPASTSFFVLDATGSGDLTGDTYDEFSNNFTLKITPSAAPVPEASTTVSFGLLLALGLGGLFVTLRKRPRTAV